MADFDGANAGTGRNIKERTFDQVWTAFDRLPTPVRRVLWDCPFNQDEVEVAELVRQGRAAGYDDASIAIVLQRLIRADIAQQAVDWGPGYPAMRFKPIVSKPRRPSRRRRQILR